MNDTNAKMNVNKSVNTNVIEIQDLRDLDWNAVRRIAPPGGSCLKVYKDGWIYKLSKYKKGSGIIGHESVNEVIADRLLDILGFEHLKYELIHALVKVDGNEYVTWLCRSRDYRQKGESKCSLEEYYRLEKRGGESPMDFCIRQGWEEWADEMILTDYLIANRDRHGTGIEVIKAQGRGEIRPAPLHDHGTSLLFQCSEDSVAKQMDVMRDYTIQSFLGGRFTTENLKLLSKDFSAAVTPLKEGDKEQLLDGLEKALSPVFRSKIWELIWKRWCRYEDICHQG